MFVYFSNMESERATSSAASVSNQLQIVKLCITSNINDEECKYKLCQRSYCPKEN